MCRWLTYSSYPVEREGRPVRRAEARADHFSLVLPQRTHKLVELDRGLAALRLRRARHARIRVERPEAAEERRDQECRTRRRQCRTLAVLPRRLGLGFGFGGGQQQQQQQQYLWKVGRDWRGRGHQGVGCDVSRVVGGVKTACQQGHGVNESGETVNFYIVKPCL